MSKLIGFSIAFRSRTEFMGDYSSDVVSGLNVGGQIFLERQNAEIVLAAERLKSPTLDWEIVEVHSA